MQKTWKPLTAGILDLIAGAGTLIACLIILVAGGGLAAFMPKEVPAWIPVFLIVFSIIYGILAVISIIGGVFAIRRKIWGWALAGSITAVFSSFSIFGIAAIVLVALSKNEFS
jgi:hypothetical protein